MKKLKHMDFLDSSRDMLLVFVRNNYEDMLKFAKHKYSDYPEVCDRVSMIFGSYIYFGLNFKVLRIVEGTYKGAYHIWLSYDKNTIIDIVSFQFSDTHEISDIFNPIVSKEDIINYVEKKDLEFPEDLRSLAISTFNFNEYLVKCENWKPSWI